VITVATIPPQPPDDSETIRRIRAILAAAADQDEEQAVAAFRALLADLGAGDEPAGPGVDESRRECNASDAVTARVITAHDRHVCRKPEGHHGDHRCWACVHTWR
jgi:hypothetical protein